MKHEDCTHASFAANVVVTRIADAGKFVADVTVSCAECGVKMRFVGLPAGSDFDRPTVNVTGEELRAPIEPADDGGLAPCSTWNNVTTKLASRASTWRPGQ